VSGDLLLAVSPGEVWAARVERGRLEELRIARDNGAPRVGQILSGRIVALKPELPAALVEIGATRPAFLSVRDAKALAGLTEGKSVVVEVTKEARADKAVGVRLSDARPATSADPRMDPWHKLLPSLLEPAPSRIVIDDRAAYATLRGTFARHYPSAAEALEFYAGSEPLFEHEGVAADLATALSRRVNLPRGGAITIETVAAATLIDVDSGGAPALSTNLAAAREGARQIVLRNIAGPVVIDFIGMKGKGGRERVAAELRKAFARDPIAPDLLGWTRLGHFELVRKRRHPSLDEILFERAEGGARIKTALTVALEALRGLAQAARAEPSRAFALRAAPEVAAALHEGPARQARLDLEARLGRPIALAPDPGLPRETFDIRPL
jgi:ribonuclease G